MVEDLEAAKDFIFIIHAELRAYAILGKDAAEYARTLDRLGTLQTKIQAIIDGAKKEPQ